MTPQGEYLEDFEISAIEQSKKVDEDGFAPEKEENECREEDEWNQQPVEDCFFVAYESILAVGHVEQTDVHDHHLDGLALNVLLAEADAFIRPEFDDEHYAWYYDDYWNQDLDFIRNFAQIFSSKNYQDLAEHRDKFKVIVLVLITIEEEPVAAHELFNLELLLLAQILFIFDQFNEFLILVDDWEEVSRQYDDIHKDARNRDKVDEGLVIAFPADDVEVIEKSWLPLYCCARQRGEEDVAYVWLE